MKNAAFSIEELFRFLDAGVSAFHSTAAAAAILEAEGYVNCPESAAWELGHTRHLGDCFFHAGTAGRAAHSGHLILFHRSHPFR